LGCDEHAIVSDARQEKAGGEPHRHPPRMRRAVAARLDGGTLIQCELRAELAG
jgi:hypothetical protein